MGKALLSERSCPCDRSCLLKKPVRSFCIAKAPHNFFQQKKITAIDFVSTVRLNKSSTDDLIKLVML